jgi:hypothetical protein
MKFLKLAAVGAALIAASTVAQAGATFDSVKKKGFVQCGTNTGLAGLAHPTAKAFGLVSILTCAKRSLLRCLVTQQNLK